MVFDHVRRMEKFDGSRHSEYETALKSVTMRGLRSQIPKEDMSRVRVKFHHVSTLDISNFFLYKTQAGKGALKEGVDPLRIQHTPNTTLHSMVSKWSVSLTRQGSSPER